jgi:putative PEP-CTERM system histidine kinase
MLAGFYLLIVAGAAYWVEIFGGNWGGVLQVAVIFAALLGLAALMLSGSLRARVKVLISKNLFSFRYEYRQEWLRFTRTLGTSEDDEGLYHRAIRAICDLVESTGGAIWLERDGAFAEVASLNLPSVRAVEPTSGSLVAFLARSDWVIQLDEVRDFPGNYKDLNLPPWLQTFREAWLIVPLPNGSELIGFVILAKPRASIDINWEVRDLLKTASRQAASYIAQIRTKEALLESKQFDAFNRMSAFVVHDLKNLVAQLALLVKNAERHRDNPEFQQDMVDTVDHAVGRMNQLMLQLRTGTQPVEKPRPIDLGAAIQRIIHGQVRCKEIIDMDTLPNLKILAHDDRIERAIGHFVQNAVEAIQNRTGSVRIRVYAEGSFAVVAIADDGVGMTNEFVREKLFHPFQTTKSHGMGIGMYESFQYINAIGGRISVETAPDSGTRFDVYLPIALVSNSPTAYSGASA